MAKSDQKGPDGLTDAERKIDSDPKHWDDPSERGPKTDDSGDTAISDPSDLPDLPDPSDLPDVNDAQRSINPQGPKNNPTIPGPRTHDKEEMEIPTHDHHTP